MPQKPQRPFIPHRTPQSARPTITASEFRLYRPFLPGSERETTESIGLRNSAGVVQRQSELSVLLEPIEDFLDTSSPAAAGHPQDAREHSSESEFAEESDELPPIEHFVDPLPVVDRFAPDADGALMDAAPDVGAELAPTGIHASDPADSGWIETDWQQYDWRAAAALGEGVDDEASNAWATTDWEGRIPPKGDLRKTAAHAIATALDEIAKRIRDGELAVPGDSAMTDPTKIATTLATLLGVKR